jgi:multidrug efflux pump subunit AcrB
MAFVGGLMGPYMRPIPIGASAAMFWSLLIAFIVTPWASIRILVGGRSIRRSLTARHRPKISNIKTPSSTVTPRISSRALPPHDGLPLLHHTGWRWGFLIGITVLLLGSMATVGLGWVKVKMLPFDNKSEFQVILNMPEGSSLEQTAAVAREMAAAIRTEPK